MNENITILKISSQVINGIGMGKDPFQEILQEAQKQNLTPNLIKAAVHHVNNQLFINHYKNNETGKVNVIDPDKIIDALEIREEKVASEESVEKDSGDMFELKKTVVVKLANFPQGYFDPANEDRLKATNKYYQLQKESEDRKKKEDLHASIVKKASEIQELKKKLYDEALLSIKREYIGVEEIDFLSKTAIDADVKEVLDLAVSRCGKKVENPILEKGAAFFNDNTMDLNNTLILKVKDITNHKLNLSKAIQEYNKLN